MIKVFGIGNPLLCDDGIGVKISKDIVDDVNYSVFTGEIFVDYCFDLIDESDFIVIIDAISCGQKAGEIRVMSFEECRKYYPSKAFCHDASLLYSLLYSHIDYKGCLIGVEVSEVTYKDGLSDKIAFQYERIKNDIVDIICNLKEDEYA